MTSKPLRDVCATGGTHERDERAKAYPVISKPERST